MVIYCGSRTLGHVHVPRIRNSPIFLNNRRTTGNHAPNHRPQIQFKDPPKITPKSQKKKRRITPQLMFSILRESINGLPIHRMWFFSWFAHTGLYVSPVGGTEGGKNEKTTRFAQTGLYVTPVGGLEGGKNEKKHVLESVVLSWLAYGHCRHRKKHNGEDMSCRHTNCQKSLSRKRLIKRHACHAK